MPNYQKHIVYLSDEQRQELFTNGSITVNGQTVTYSDNDMYVTPQEVPYVKPTNGIPASDLDPSALNSKADKNNTTITGSLSLYRKANTTVGTASVALGANGTASGIYSTAFGNTTIASGTSSFAMGTNTEANGVNSVAEGNYAIADGRNAHVAGEYTKADGRANFVHGRANVLNTTAIFPEWAAETEYAQYDRVKVTTESNGETIVTLYMCTTSHTSTSTFDSSKWENVTDYKDFVEIVGNGRNGTDRSNAYALDWNGNAYFRGNVYVGCDDDSTGGSVLPRDVQVNGTSVVQNGVANVPVANDSTLGVVKVGGYGMGINGSGSLYLNGANEIQIKAGVYGYGAITAIHQHESTFYGLTKAAGVDMSSSSNSVGTYTNEAKIAIRNMLGAASTEVVAIQDEQPTNADTKVWLPESQAVGVEVPTMADLDNYVQKTDLATTTVNGIVHANSFGVKVNNTGELYISKADITSEVKPGAANYLPIVPSNQHAAAFYGLAKAAGDATQSASDNAVGTYTADAKSAIQSMLGIDFQSIASEVEIPLVETVTGSTPSITGQPNTRYNCGEVSTISITPPSAGSIDVIFESGSTAAVLTVPNTVKFPAWFDATALEADTTYEILITDGVYGSVMTWAN